MKKAARPIPPGRRMAGRVFLGLCLAAGGAVLLLNNLGRLPVELDWRLWPLFLVALAGARMIERGALRGGPHALILVALFLLAAGYERDDLIHRINARRLAIQHAVDALHPYTEEASAPIRKIFKLSLDRPFNG